MHGRDQPSLLSFEGSSEPSFRTDRQRDTASSYADRLGTVDWSFSGRSRVENSIEALHPYPAKFIAEIPRALLDILPVRDELPVLDPFCGGGTTLAECQRLGLTSIGIDLNPIACLISKVKTSPLPAKLDLHLIQVLDSSGSDTDIAVPQIPNLNHWFEPQVQEALACLKRLIDQSDPTCRDVLRLAMSSIIVRVSNQESDTRYAAVKKSVTYRNVFELFRRAVLRIKSALQVRSYSLTETRVIQADTLSVTPECFSKKVGLVITSPPYPNAYEYWLYHKYRMWWLDEDPLLVKSQEIGARAHFFKKDHHTEGTFVDQMTRTLDLISRILSPGGYACFVIGRSKIHGKTIDNAALIEKAAISLGFRPYFAIERVLSPHRKSFNLSHANIKTETLLVLQYEGSKCV